jgi:DNA-binding transcriptional LysR family regulator
MVFMREVNIAGVDLNLVPALDALLRLRNVTRAAQAVGLSQPAMSRALARLRELHNDQLLVRTRSGYALTPRARAMQPELAAAIHALRGIFERKAFDPAQERRVLRLAATDAQAVLLMGPMMKRLADDAPGVDLRVESYGGDLFARLESGAIDLAFALSSTQLPPGVYSETVFEDRLALVLRRGHPAAKKKWTLADYGRVSHVGVALLGDGQSEIDALLATKGIRRRIALVTPHFVTALAAVAVTDMVTTVSAALSHRFAPALGLALLAPPFKDVDLRMTLLCSHIRAADPFLAWFRTVVRDIARSQMVQHRGL